MENEKTCCKCGRPVEDIQYFVNVAFSRMPILGMTKTGTITKY